MAEQWKKHPVWDIEVSSFGRVRRNGKVKQLSQKVYRTKKELRYHVCSVGGRGFPILRVARLVLETFVGPCPDGMDCRHLDGNSLDDRRTNLKWGTRREQIADQKRHGTFSPPPVLRGDKNPAYRHNPEKYVEAFSLVAQGYSVRATAKMIGISKSQLLRRLRAVEEVTNG